MANRPKGPPAAVWQPRQAQRAVTGDTVRWPSATLGVGGCGRAAQVDQQTRVGPQRCPRVLDTVHADARRRRMARLGECNRPTIRATSSPMNPWPSVSDTVGLSVQEDVSVICQPSTSQTRMSPCWWAATAFEPWLRNNSALTSPHANARDTLARTNQRGTRWPPVAPVPPVGKPRQPDSRRSAACLKPLGQCVIDDGIQITGPAAQKRVCEGAAVDFLRRWALR